MSKSVAVTTFSSSSDRDEDVFERRRSSSIADLQTEHRPHDIFAGSSAPSCLSVHALSPLLCLCVCVTVMTHMWHAG